MGRLGDNGWQDMAIKRGRGVGMGLQEKEGRRSEPSCIPRLRSCISAIAIICVWGEAKFFAIPLLTPLASPLSSLPLPIGGDMAEKLGMLLFPSTVMKIGDKYKFATENVFSALPPTLNLPGGHQN